MVLGDNDEGRPRLERKLAHLERAVWRLEQIVLFSLLAAATLIAAEIALAVVILL